MRGTQTSNVVSLFTVKSLNHGVMPIIAIYLCAITDLEHFILFMAFHTIIN